MDAVSKVIIYVLPILYFAAIAAYLLLLPGKSAARIAWAVALAMTSVMHLAEAYAEVWNDSALVAVPYHRFAVDALYVAWGAGIVFLALYARKLGASTLAVRVLLLASAIVCVVGALLWFAMPALFAIPSRGGVLAASTLLRAGSRGEMFLELAASIAILVALPKGARGGREAVAILAAFNAPAVLSSVAFWTDVVIGLPLGIEGFLGPSDFARSPLSTWMLVACYLVLPIALLAIGARRHGERVPAYVAALAAVPALVALAARADDSTVLVVSQAFAPLGMAALLGYALARFGALGSTFVPRSMEYGFAGVLALAAYGASETCMAAILPEGSAWAIPLGVLGAALGLAAGIASLEPARALALPRALGLGAPGEPAQPFARGRVVLGRYRVDRLLAEGGEGRAFLAFDERAERKVVLKAVAEARGRGLAREARALRAIDHANVVRVLDVIRAPGHEVLVLEYLAGGNLAGLLHRRGALPPGMARQLALDLLAGLAAAHERGIAHGDVKPENVLLAEDGTAKVADFGLATGGDAGAVTVTTHGTLAYLAPERVRGGPPDARSDVYAAALVIHRTIVGKPAIPIDALDDFRAREAMVAGVGAIALPEWASAWEPILARGMARDASARFSDAGEMLRAVRAGRESGRAAEGLPSRAGRGDRERFGPG